jgi:hypothetical protein
MSCRRVKVECYSGHTYAGSPRSFELEDIRYEVRAVEKEWLEPGERHFRVRTQEGGLFELWYVESGDEWFVIECLSKSE